MKGVFDVPAFILLVLGVLVLLLGLKNYKLHKENFEVRYFRYASGVTFLLAGFVRIFIRTNRFLIIIPIVLIFSISSMATYIRYKKHTS